MGANAVDLIVRGRTRDAVGELRGLESGIDRTDRAAKRSRISTAAWTAALLGLSAAVAKTAADGVKYGDWLEKTAQRTDLSVESLSAYSQGLREADTDQATFARGAVELSRKMAEALESETSNAARAFEALGIEVDDDEGKLRDIESVIDDVADAFAGMEDGATKTVLAGRVLGEEVGTQLIPFLNEGSAGLREMRAESEALALVWTEQDAAAAAELNDEIARMMGMLRGFSEEAVRAYLPTFVDLARGARLFTEELLNLGGAEQRRRDSAATGRAQEIVQAQAEEVSAIQKKIDIERENIRWAEENSLTTEGFRINIERLTAERERELDVLRRLQGELPEWRGLQADVNAEIETSIDLTHAFTGAIGAGDTELEAHERRLDALAQRFRLLGETDGQRFTRQLELLNQVYATGRLSVEEYSSALDKLLEQLRGAEAELAIVNEATIAAQQSNLAYADTFGAVGDMAGAVSGLIIGLYGEQNKEARTAAKVMFGIQQALALASATVNLADAISEANASAPPPFNIPAIVQASVVGGAQIATIIGTTIAGIADAGMLPGALRDAGLNNHSAMIVRNDEAIVDPVGTAHLTKQIQLTNAVLMQQAAGGGRSMNVTIPVYVGGRKVQEEVRHLLIDDIDSGNDFRQQLRTEDL